MIEITTPTWLWHTERGTGPDVLLIGGLGDSHAAWQAQLDALSDRYRLIAPDNRGAGRTPLPPDGVTFPAAADDAAALLRDLGVESAHVAGFSGGGAIAQEVALRHPGLVSSLVLVSTWCRPDEYCRRMVRSWITAAATAQDERELLSAFYLWIYTRRAHEDGSVDRFVDEVLADQHPQTPEAFVAWAEASLEHDTADRLGAIDVPALVIAGDEDIAIPPRFSQEIAARVPDARLVVLPGEAHQPFQESPERFNDLVDGFWREVEGRRS
ncbi:MAG: alpha/beta hydrolase [Thermoleophilaceae bacterium]